MTYPGDGQGGWGGQSGQGQGDWGQQNQGYPQQQPGYGYGDPQQQQPGYGGYQQQPNYGYQPGYGDPQQQQPGYGGLGVFSGGGPPKKNRTALWVALGVAVVLVAGGVTAFVLTRDDGSNQAGPDQSSSAPAPTTTTGKPKTTSPSPDVPVTCKAAKADWNCLPVPDLSYSYDVPKDWSPLAGATAPVDAVPDAKLIGLTVTGKYDCEGKSYNRGGTGGVVVKQTDLATVAKDFAGGLAKQYYSSGGDVQVKVTEPKAVKIQFDNKGKKVDIEGVQVDATATASANKCLATKGMVKILVLKGDTGFHVFMANGDLEGGPTTPAPPTEADLQAMVDSVKPLPTS